MPLSTHTNALTLNFCFLSILTLNFFHYFELKVYPKFMLYTLSMPVFLNHRDADVFLPGLELFLKLKKSLNSTLIRYQLFTLVNKNYWKCISSKAYTPWYYVTEKHYLKTHTTWTKISKKLWPGQRGKNLSSTGTWSPKGWETLLYAMRQRDQHKYTGIKDIYFKWWWNWTKL
jgi:hypothetical protein